MTEKIKIPINLISINTKILNESSVETREARRKLLEKKRREFGEKAEALLEKIGEDAQEK